MKDFLKKTAALFRKTWVWSLCLVLVLALLIWFVGPLLAVADSKFWESAASRLVSISLLFLAWGLFIVFISWRANVRKKAEADDVDAQERLRREGLISEEQVELRGRFKQALRTLKTSSLYRGRSDKWRNELPWYLLLGPEGSASHHPAPSQRQAGPAVRLGQREGRSRGQETQDQEGQSRADVPLRGQLP